MAQSGGAQVLRLILFAAVLLGSSILITNPVHAAGFSGSDPEQYTCPSRAVSDPVPLLQQFIATFGNCALPTDAGVFNCNGRYVCFIPKADGSGFDARDAYPKPPTLRVIEIWFVRILYAVWALSGIVFTGRLMWLGGQYAFSFGNPVSVAAVIKKFQNFVVGFVLVFLSYPILNTFFSVLPLSQNTDCFATLNLPGFQFFFPTACGDPEVVQCMQACDYNRACERQCRIDACTKGCISLTCTIACQSTP